METLILFGVFYCAYKLHMMSEQTKKERNNTLSKEQIEETYYKRLVKLKGSSCEINLKHEMLTLDTSHNVIGTVEEIDRQWVLIQIRRNKKCVQRLIRIFNIEHIKEIHE